MKTILDCRLLPFVALFATLFSMAKAAEPVKIFILAGQSNMVGHGNMTPVTAVNTLEHLVDPANDTAGDYQFLVDGAVWKSWDDVWIHYARSGGTVKGDLTTGYGTNSRHVGPEIGFGHVASGQYENQALIIKCAWGGKSLGRDFLPPSAESYPSPGGWGQGVLLRGNPPPRFLGHQRHRRALSGLRGAGLRDRRIRMASGVE